MKKVFYFIAFMAVVITAGCGSKEKKSEKSPVEPSAVDLKGDRTRYGLACEGCTDSVIYFLPKDNSDPIKYNILDAFVNHRVFGRPRIGDNIAIIVNRQDTTVADFVINLDNLMSTWCYVVMPKMRDYNKMSKKMQARMMRNMPDSLKQSYLIPREYGFTLKTENSAMPVGMVSQGNSLEDESPVVYPILPFYRQWHLLNGKLILSRTNMPMMNVDKKKGGNKGVPFQNDTCDIVYMDADSLVLQFRDHLQSYYRISDATDANRLARQKAEQLAKKAQNEVKNDD